MTDLVNNPQHYQAGNGIEAIDVIEGFLKKYDHRDQVVKYNLRAGDKDNFLQDLEKSAWYLNRTIENFKAGKFTVGSPPGTEIIPPFGESNEELMRQEIEEDSARLTEAYESEDPKESTPKPDKLAIYKDEDDDYWAIGNDGLWRWYFLHEGDVESSGYPRTWEAMVGGYGASLCSSGESERIEPLIRKHQEENGY